MEWLDSLVLGVVQGITEFLPVSSDGHLLLTQNFFAWMTGVTKTGEENLFFDVILHLGTTAAILVPLSRGDRRRAYVVYWGPTTSLPGFVVRRSCGWACWRPSRPLRSFRWRSFSRS